jgi:hypothetical protein
MEKASGGSFARTTRKKTAEDEGRRRGQGRQGLGHDAKQIRIAGLLSYVPPGCVLAGASGHDPKSLSAFVERSDLLTLKKS